jgi:F-type H+-transporting ATPase subunit b
MTGRICRLLLPGIALCLIFWGDPVAAAEETGGFRATYDLVMKWINFGILVVLFLKFGKKPLMEFLRGRKSEIAREIGNIEAQRDKVAETLREANRALQESEQRLDEIRRRIVQDGERRKLEIIAEAKEQSLLMFTGAKRKIDNRFLKAKETLKAELIESAMEIALEKLPREITDADRENMVERYLSGLSAARP